MKKKSHEEMIKEISEGKVNIQLPYRIRLSRFLGFTTGIFVILLILLGVLTLIKLCVLYLFGG